MELVDRNKQNRFRCPCCGFYTLSVHGLYDICPVCYWEDDPLQLKDEARAGGANKVCLCDARKNYLKIGACEAEYVNYVRKPRPEEFPPKNK